MHRIDRAWASAGGHGGSVSIFDLIYRLSRWALGAVFIFAGGTKLLEPRVFAVLIEAFGIVPHSLLMPVTVFLPAVEVAAGVGLIFDLRGSLAAIISLLALFLTILGYGIWMGLDVDCGCFGPQDPEAAAFHGLRLSLYRDLVMMGGAGFLYYWRWLRKIRPLGVAAMVNKMFIERRKENAYVPSDSETGADPGSRHRAGCSGRGFSGQQV